jgi:hypothetical protein
MEVNINTFGSVMESWTRDQMNNGWVITEQDGRRNGNLKTG